MATKCIFEMATVGDVKEVERLLHNGIGVNTRNKMGQTPLWLAVENQTIDVVKLL